MGDTMAACYKGFYTDQYSFYTHAHAPATDYAAALRWMRAEWRPYSKEGKRAKASEKTAKTVREE